MEDLIIKLEDDYYKSNINYENTKVLTRFLSCYRAYVCALLRAQKEYERKECPCESAIYFYSYNPYNNQLFSKFKSNDFLYIHEKKYLGTDRVFLIDSDTLLLLRSDYIFHCIEPQSSMIDYVLIKIDKCLCKDLNKKVLHNSYPIETNYEENDQDIREILEIQTIEEIYNKILEVKKEKVKELSLL